MTSMAGMVITVIAIMAIEAIEAGTATTVFMSIGAMATRNPYTNLRRCITNHINRLASVFFFRWIFGASAVHAR